MDEENVSSFPKMYFRPCQTSMMERFLRKKISFRKKAPSWVFNSFRKACVRYFLINFYFSPNDSPSKTMKDVFYFI